MSSTQKNIHILRCTEKMLNKTNTKQQKYYKVLFSDAIPE